MKLNKLSVLNKKGKKAQEQAFTYVIIVVLIILSFFFIVYFILTVGGRYDRIAVDSACKASILSAVHSDCWFVSKLNCPTNYIEFDGNSQSEVKKDLANGMASCYDRFGRGRLILFEHEPSLFGTDSVSYCNICEVYEFKDVPKINSFADFLAENRVADIYDSTNPKYIEFFAGVQMQDESLTEFKSKAADQVIDTSRAYASVFTYTKDPSILRSKYQFKQAFSSDTSFGFIYHSFLALAFGREVGAEWKSQVFLLPYDKDEIHSISENLKE